MKNAKLTALEIENFKSFKEPTRVEFAPLTILLGRNNSGKSSIIQSLLLLKQTLNEPRSEVPLKLEGIVEAVNLRELTFGWPTSSLKVKGPTIKLEWECNMNILHEWVKAGRPDMLNLSRHSKLDGLPNLLDVDPINIKTSMTIHTSEIDGDASISKIEMQSLHKELKNAAIKIVRSSDTTNNWLCHWKNKKREHIKVEVDHFIPYLHINRSAVGPRHSQRAVYNAYLLIFAQPLEALKSILSEFQYLGSDRQASHSVYKPATIDPREIGVSGELAAQLLHRRQRDIVHFPPPLQVEDGVETTLPEKVYALSLVEAVNQVMKALSINTPLRVNEIEQIGFQLMFGNASLPHVGRGLSYLLPLVELGLFTDPLRFTHNRDNMDLDEYQNKCKSFSHIALEEPEAHLHPKVASRLAHWLVSLALANRRFIVETHSDHLVRRLRGLAVRSGRGSELERWLLENVVILNIEQNDDGRSKVIPSRLTSEGGLEEQWPADFMDEATDEESAIYYAKLDKSEPVESQAPFEVIDGEEPEPEDAP
ncbi:AAA family ATPase [Candidatus Venteria ishoeyi]|uniref:Endonuclease GajA/Old nuclease/RecF-like AAA domain-containing protein n=1 Tax=Candidatus Venteria ishoeyi TaxID=1899563 RepID=A0A1H6F9S9_9GAMM|nr:AAA family ATPase [Candidatus Venteria ishoeyi]SEH06131.1 Uncharacterised protein [Candidatus Venteria ishoeyi]